MFDSSIYNAQIEWKVFQKCTKSWQSYAFLSVCKHFEVIPKGLCVKNVCCMGGESRQFLDNWEEVTLEASRKLLNLLIDGRLQQYENCQNRFWNIIQETLTNSTSESALRDFINKLWNELLNYKNEWEKVAHRKLL